MARRNELPDAVGRRIMERATRGERRVVVTIKAGKPRRVWGFDEYLARQALTAAVKPWNRRRVPPDPLGAIDGSPVGPITRDEIYDD